MSLLGKPRHQNTVRLLGYWHNDTDLMILYEYMPNGSLWEALHGPVASHGRLDGAPNALKQARSASLRNHCSDSGSLLPSNPHNDLIAKVDPRDNST